MRFHVLTLFPNMIENAMSESILGRAQKNGLIQLNTVNIRDFSKDKHKKTDDYPYGGGAGLLMQAQPVYDAHTFVREQIERERGVQPKKVRTVYLTPQGKVFHQRMAEELAKEEDVIFLCGHYEGIDERVLEEVVTDYVSLGDFVLTGGELPAMVMMDSIARLVPEVLHNDDSAADESFSGYLLEYPQYSRPEVFLDKPVPGVLLGGDHKKIRQWRLEQAKERTRQRRPDLYAAYEEIIACGEALRKNKLLHMDMLSAIERGRAKLLFYGQEGALLYDRGSKTYLLTARDVPAGEFILNSCEADFAQTDPDDRRIVTHQVFLNPMVERRFGLAGEECHQWVYTRRESLPVDKAETCRLEGEQAQCAAELCKELGVSFEKEFESRKDIMGVFCEGSLAGFAGEYTDGSMGQPVVFSKYSEQGFERSLITAQVNRILQKGLTPYMQVSPKDTACETLLEKLGLYPAKESVWRWKP